MPEYTFGVPANQTIARENLVALINTGTREAPVWSPLGANVTESSLEMDWSDETEQDILGRTRTTKKKPVTTQSFDPWTLEGGDTAQEFIYNLAVVQQDAQALASQDMLIAHYYTTRSGSTGHFAERYSACSIGTTSLGGEGGGNIAMPVEVTYGGERTIGEVVKAADGKVTFTPASDVEA